MAPRPVPDAIAGPTDPHTAAAFYNPAAMGYLRGANGFLDAGARAYVGSIDRDAVGGRNGGGTSIGYANLDSFAGLVWDLGTNQFSVGIAAYTPFTEMSSYPANSTVRYQERWQQFISFEQTLAVAWKPERHFSIGAGFIINESWIDYRFARDAAPAGGSALVQKYGYENAMLEEDVRLRGYATGFGFSAGALIRPVDRLWIGLSYTDHQAGGDINLTAQGRASVTLSPSQKSAALSGDDQVIMLLPETAQAAVRVNVTPRLDVEAAFRFIHYGARSAMDVSVQGGNLAQSTIPPEQLYDRGLQNTYAVEVSTRHQVGRSLRLSPSLMFETSAIAPSAVSAATLEGNKLAFALTMEWQAWHGLANHAVIVGAHLGGTAYFIGRVTSRFDAAAETRCVDANYSLATCAAFDFGDALPSASGNYSLFVVDAGAALGFTY
jgi:long-subunit fatty acid transport protein